MNASKLCAVLLVGLLVVKLIDRGTAAPTSAEQSMTTPRYQISGGGPGSNNPMYVINTQTGRLWQVYPQEKKFIPVGEVPDKE